MNNIKKTCALYALMIFTYLVLIFAVNLLPQGTLSKDALYILPELILMVPALFYIMFMKPETDEDISFKLPSPKILLIIVIIAMCLIPVCAVPNLLTSIGTDPATKGIANDVANMSLVKALLYVAVIPAICEEYLFRGLVYHGLRRRNKFAAVLISSAMFGLMHLNLNQFSYAFVMGIVAAILVELTGSLWSSMLLHFIMNGVTTTSAYALPKLQDMVNLDEAEKSVKDMAKAAEIAQMVYSAIFFIGLVVIAACILILGIKKVAEKTDKLQGLMYCLSKEGRKTYVGEGKFNNVYLWIGIVPAAVWVIFFFVIQYI